MSSGKLFYNATSIRGSFSTNPRPFRLAGLSVVGAFVVGLVTSQAAADSTGLEIGNKLADILRAGRSAVSANQPLINNPDIADKGFTGEKLIQEAQAIYAKGNFEYPVEPGTEPSELVQSWGTFTPDDLAIGKLHEFQRDASTLVDEVRFDQ